MKQRLNFSPKPFRVRSKQLLALWTLNLSALLAFAWMVRYGLGLHADNLAVHQQLGQLKAKQDEIAAAHRSSLERLENLEIREYRKQIEQFAAVQRGFNTQWGPLLDEISLILPEDVRLLNLRPSTPERGADKQQTEIRLSAEARRKQAQLDFIETLQKHTSFKDIRLQSESYSKTGESLGFELIFTYQPKGE